MYLADREAGQGIGAYPFSVGFLGSSRHFKR
jgi:hypothetical protein